MKLTRWLYASLLKKALADARKLCPSDAIHLGLISHCLQKEMKDPDSLEVEFTGLTFGRELFPDLTPNEWDRLTLCNFLDAFPELVSAFSGVDGEVAVIRDLPKSVGFRETSHEYQYLLKRSIREISCLRADGTVPVSQLAKWLPKRAPEFDLKKIGFASVPDWLECQKDLYEVYGQGAAQCVRRIEGNPDRPMHAVVKSPKVPAGHLIVDSVDMLSQLHLLYERKPPSGARPDWGKMMKFFRETFPADDWKGIYHITIPHSQASSVKGLTNYLSNVGFSSMEFYQEPTSADQGENLRQRAFRNQASVADSLKSLAGQAAHIFVASHSCANAEVLRELLKEKKPDQRIGVIGFPALMDSDIRSLVESGLLLIDIENDAQLYFPDQPKRK